MLARARATEVAATGEPHRRKLVVCLEGLPSWARGAGGKSGAGTFGIYGWKSTLRARIFWRVLSHCGRARPYRHWTPRSASPQTRASWKHERHASRKRPVQAKPNSGRTPLRTPGPPPATSSEGKPECQADRPIGLGPQPSASSQAEAPPGWEMPAFVAINEALAGGPLGTMAAVFRGYAWLGIEARQPAPRDEGHHREPLFASPIRSPVETLAPSRGHSRHRS